MYRVVIGGVRSGKSRFAVELAERSGSAVSFVATAEAGDEEMTARIAAHRDERPASWSTVESPLRLAAAIEALPAQDYLVVDCLTVWTANLLLAEVPPTTVIAEAERVAVLLADRPGAAVVVTNEVGMGVHPSSELGRRYRDLLGAVNVAICARAADVALIVAGRALPLRSVSELGW